jgi:Tfp pilus assembly protein PilE
MRRRRLGFSLQELMVVIAIVVLLTGMLLPALSQVRENAHRVVCASNQRQIGLAMFMYANDNRTQLPVSKWLDPDDQFGDGQPQELMSATTGGSASWDGVGLLFRWYYCDVARCFYCPSHHGEHPAERYADEWSVTSAALEPIYTNFHYAGHLDWDDGDPRRLFNSDVIALLTDGLRTKQDFNHRVGMNVLRNDGSVVWHEDTEGIYNKLPDTEFLSDAEAEAFHEVWFAVEEAAGEPGPKGSQADSFGPG